MTYFVKAGGAITGTILIGAVVVGMLSAPMLAAMKDPACNGGVSASA